MAGNSKSCLLFQRLFLDLRCSHRVHMRIADLWLALRCRRTYIIIDQKNNRHIPYRVDSPLFLPWKKNQTILMTHISTPLSRYSKSNQWMQSMGQTSIAFWIRSIESASCRTARQRPLSGTITKVFRNVRNSDLTGYLNQIVNIWRKTKRTKETLPVPTTIKKTSQSLKRRPSGFS